MLETWCVIYIVVALCAICHHIKVLLHTEHVSIAAFKHEDFFDYMLFLSMYAAFLESAGDLIVNYRILYCTIHLS